MIAELGFFSLLLVPVATVYGLVTGILGIRRDDRRFQLAAQRALIGVFSLISLASAALMYSLLTQDHSVAYVAFNSNRAMPLLYKLTSWWGASEGSILFWTWLLGLFGTIAIFLYRREHPQMMPYVVVVMLVVIFFFNLVNVAFSNPFHRLFPSPTDGLGMNPLLQNPFMAAHPPNLYMGFLAFSIPYAFAMAALFTGELGNRWLVATRQWTILAWIFLTVGIILGGHWAYIELGWGGYWAWDPVENASFLPWLTGTAYLHSVMSQEHRGMMKVWNLALIIVTFSLAMFGTFLTRSGLLSSVHTFTESGTGPVLLTFIALLLIVSIGLLIRRSEKIEDERRMHSFLSREGGFMLNNLVLLAAAFTVLLGTIFPIMAEAVRGEKVTVGAAFFNAVFVPIALLLLALMAVGPLLAWGRSTPRYLLRLLATPMFLTVLIPLGLFALGVRHGGALLAFALAVFVASTVLTEFYRGTRARHRARGEAPLTALRRLIGRNRRRYGGLIVHLGVAVVVVGITASSSFDTEREITLKPGEVFTIGDYELTYQGPQPIPHPNQMTLLATFDLSVKGRPAGRIATGKNFYVTRDEDTSEVGLRSSWSEDLYLVMLDYQKESRGVTVWAKINPLVRWVWIGGGIILLGGLVALSAGRPRRRREEQDERADPREA